MSVLLASLRQSSTRQYESCWKKFQSFLAARDPPVLSQAVVLDFLSWLFYDRRLSSRSVVCHWSALSDPLRVGCGLVVDDRLVSQLRRGFFHLRPPPRRPAPAWSLQRVLDYLASLPPSPESSFRRALFLVAMASGLRVSQLHALTRQPALTAFAGELASVSLAPSPGFLAKNEREGHRLGPIVIPAWLVDGVRQPLCPVSALRAYLDATAEAPPARLFVFPASGVPCSRRQIVNALKDIIRRGDPGSEPHSKDLRSFASSLAFFRLVDVQPVRVQGQWRSDVSFCRNYFRDALVDAPCVALGVLPP